VYFKKDPFEDIIQDSPRRLKARGFIDFSEVTEVRVHKKNKDRFTLVTEARKWHFLTKNKDCPEWVALIQKTVDSLKANRLEQVPLDESTHIELETRK